MVKNSDLIKDVNQKIDFGLSAFYEVQKEYIDEWKPFRRLWETDKNTILTEYSEKQWKASCFEDDINE